MAEHTIRHQSPMMTEEHRQDSGCDSPRSRVARRLGSLNIYMDRNHSASPSPSKRAKIDSTSSQDVDIGRYFGRNTQSNTIDGSMRIMKKLSPRNRSLSPQSKDSNTDAGAPSVSDLKRYRSPPPPPLQSMDDRPPVDGSALTWQISEITGMDVDVLAGDDGEGINGIGFRPTPQMAHVRRQKRKQQIDSWRMREAREARQKRFEKRNGCKLHAGSRDKRLVRFAEVV